MGRYDGEHRRLRAALLPGAYGRRCPRCGERMLPGQALDLGHADVGGGWQGMEHAACNRAAGARSGKRRRRKLRTSRDW